MDTLRQRQQRRYHAGGIVTLLEARHSKDVFVAECKDGPTQSGSHLRLDAWAMAKSWANPCAIGYEVKVSRADFIGDNKWPAYLPLCNQFYFVAPKGIIEPSELSPDAGLLLVAGDGEGTRLITKRKAPYRSVEIPENLYRYILMCRVQVGPEEPQETTEQEWRRWLERKQENRTLGYQVSRAIRERAVEIERENARLNQRIETYDSLLTVLNSYGVNPESWGADRDLEHKLEAQRKVFNPEFIGSMRSAHRVLESALAEVDKMEAEALNELSLEITNEERQGSLVSLNNI